ncbi:MAG: DUF429 domain-containing protein, partial [Candidatus Acidiferrales bacterium]
GVDIYKKGWIAAIDGDNRETFVESFETFSDIARRTDLELVVIDIPIGLPAVGHRLADVEARQMLKSRACCVFSAPLRPLLECDTYDKASTRRNELEGKRCSRQAFSIIPKIRSVDDLLATDMGLRERVKEGHPEVTFAVMNGEQAISVSKHKGEGRGLRLALLRKWFGAEVLAGVAKLKYPAEDVIHAYAMLWTARRVFNHDPALRTFPHGPAPVDPVTGIPMQITA